jgi:hypothetical protein
MMDYYDIISLIVFLKKQSQNDFKGIHELIEVVNSKTIPENDKGALFIQTFRKHGLKEIEFPEINIEEHVLPVDLPGEISWKKYHSSDYQLDLYVLNLLTGKKRFIQNLN